MKRFEYMAKFFENSLAELSKRNADIDGQFRRIDANRIYGCRLPRWGGVCAL